MKPRSCKSKGREGQKEVRDMLLPWFPADVQAGDLRCAIMGESGGDIKMSPLALSYWPYNEPEVKRTEKLRLDAAIEQNRRCGEDVIVFHRKNRGEWLVTLRAKDLLNNLGYRERG